MIMKKYKVIFHECDSDVVLLTLLDGKEVGRDVFQCVNLLVDHLNHKGIVVPMSDVVTV